MRRINSRSSLSARSSITAGIVTVAGLQEQPPAIATLTLHYHDIRKRRDERMARLRRFFFCPRSIQSVVACRSSRQIVRSIHPRGENNEDEIYCSGRAGSDARPVDHEGGS